MMNEETIVAVFDTAAHADAAVRDLEGANVPASAISRHPSTTGTAATTTGAPRETGFWSSLFGGEPDHGTTVYDRSVESGSHVVTVKVSDHHIDNVTSILERHNPVDIDERAASYGLGGIGTGSAVTGSAGTGSVGTGSVGTGSVGTGNIGTTTTTTRETIGTEAGVGAPNTALHGNEERLQLSEEQLQVGKRLVNRGTTRIRRFVVETPVEENVTLHSERVSVERRPVTGDARVANADFTDRTIEVTETDEEAVVGKTARVREEVVVRKDVADRVETVRDAVRHEDVEITKDGAVETDVGKTDVSKTDLEKSDFEKSAGTVPPTHR
jgi:uncharacterized protein (TIGR02271 family)